MKPRQTAQLHALTDTSVDDEKATSLFNRKGKPQPLRGPRPSCFCSRGGHAAADGEGRVMRWGRTQDQNGGWMGEAHITDLGYPHALNRHDVGWETAETDKPTGTGPSHTHRDVCVDHHDRKKKAERERERESDATMGTRNFGGPALASAKPATHQDGNSASELADLPGFTSHASTHPPSNPWNQFSGVAPLGAERGNPQIGLCRPPPFPASPRSSTRRTKKPLQAPTVQATQTQTHPPGIASKKKKRVWHSTAANRQGGCGWCP